MSAARKPFRYDVFVSYSHRNEDWVVGWLVPRLKEAGFVVCLDRESFEPGAPLLTEMERAAEESRKTLLALTPEYLRSEWTEFENLLAQGQDKAARRRRVIPLLLERCKLPARLSGLVHLDFSQPEKREKAFGRLVGALGRASGTSSGQEAVEGERAERPATLPAARPVPRPEDRRLSAKRSKPAEARGRPMATLRGSGSAIAQGPDAIAAAEGSLVVTGSINHSKVVVGKKNIVADTIVIQKSGGRAREARKVEAALRSYREFLFGRLRYLPLGGLDVAAAEAGRDRGRLELAQVYVRLNTKTHVAADEHEAKQERGPAPSERETHPLSVLEAVIGHQHAVLLGDPGSGKSTFLNHLALCLIGHALQPGQQWPARLPEWPKAERDILPVFVLLRDFASGLSSPPKANTCPLWDFVEAQLKAQALGPVVDPLSDAMDQGRAIVLLDGLDEVPTREKRIAVRRAVSAFAERFRHCRFIVTCRTLSYQDPEGRVEGFDPFELAPFDEERIDGFIEAWYDGLAAQGVLATASAQGLAGRLREAVRRPDIAWLAPNPMLLTVMAIVHTHRGRLPEARVQLYDEAADILLWRWDEVRFAGSEGARGIKRLLVEANRGEMDLKRVLWRMAFEANTAHELAVGEPVADISEPALQKALAALHPAQSRDWAYDVIRAIKERAGLLLERAPEVYTFPHRTFQEYLAGCHLSTQADFARRSAALLDEGYYWLQVILLAVGRLVHTSGDTDKPLALVGELCPEVAADDEKAARKARFAGEVLVEIGPNRIEDSTLGKDLARRVRDRLVGVIQGDSLGSIERAGAGGALARLGDPRFRPDAWYLPDEPLLGFVEIPAGPFLMGSDPERDPRAFDDETPQREVDLVRYLISRYPVTVAQFRAFLEAEDHAPEDPASLRGLSNCPVVRISWHEALAYTDWLTRVLRGWPNTPELLASLLRAGGGERAWRATLPSEAEWEKAARGTDGRFYPWGNKPDPQRANYHETGIGSASAVGCFRGGTSPFGIEEMSGNVWEWTRSLSGKYPYERSPGRENVTAPDTVARVLRGGAFSDPLRSVRCACRDWFNPYFRFDGIGFRVVLCPCSTVSEP